MTERQKYTAFSSLTLAVISASLVLFPSITALAKPPLVYLWVMWVYLAGSFGALVTLSSVYYIATFTSDGLPPRLSGVGSILVAVSLIAFCAFLFLNLYQDQAATPQIVGMTASTYEAAPGSVVALTGESFNESGHVVTWEWCIDPPAAKNPGPKAFCLPGNLKTATWAVPTGAPQGIYTVKASVHDGSIASLTHSMEVKIWQTK